MYRAYSNYPCPKWNLVVQFKNSKFNFFFKKVQLLEIFQFILFGNVSSNLTALWLLYRYMGSFQVFMEEKFVHICIAWLMHNLVQQSIILLIAHFQLDITKGGQYCQLITNIYILYISSWSVVSITHSEPQGLRPDRVDV